MSNFEIVYIRCNEYETDDLEYDNNVRGENHERRNPSRLLPGNCNM